jgi:hypothetical protein
MSALRLGTVLLALVGAWTLGCGGDDSNPQDTSEVTDNGETGEGGADGDADADADADGDGDADADADGDADADADGDADADADGDGDADADGDGDADGGTVCGPMPGMDCGAGETCNVLSCGDGATGTCETTPLTCPRLWDPVCGCDATTYANDCERLRAGVSLDHTGECGSAGDCGGIAGTPCTTLGEVCDIRSCDLDAMGTCVLEFGRCPDGWDPVCGCDGVTYRNDCFRLRAAVAWSADGMCGSGAVCGPGATACAAEEVCNTLSCDVDAMGVCVVLPTGRCADAGDAVCGCDGTTYANDCLRIEAGAGLDHTGACATAACMPTCTGLGGRRAWHDPCTDTNICAFNCMTCTATCQEIGSYSEGWYATCTDPSITDGGCGVAPNLIAYADCG